MTGFLRLGEASLSLTRTSLDDFAKFARSAGDELMGEVFCLSHSGSEEVMQELARKGVRQRFLLDPEHGQSVAPRIARMAGAESRFYGDMPMKNHAKLFHTGDRSMMITGAFTGRTAQRIEGVVMLSGETSAAAREVSEAAWSGDVERMRRAVRNAERLGVVLNDSITGEQLLTKRLHQLIDTTQHELTISTKIYTDVGIRSAVDRAVQRGVNVKFTDIRGGGMHATLVIGDNQVYVGTAHLSPRAMGDRTRAYRKAREVGVFVNDSKVARDLRVQLDGMKLPVYDPARFERTRVAYDAMDAPRHIKDQIERLAPGADDAHLQARLAEAQAKKDPANAEWNALRDEVQAARKADGMKFVPDSDTQRQLDAMHEAWVAGNPVPAAAPKPAPAPAAVADDVAPAAAPAADDAALAVQPADEKVAAGERGWSTAKTAAAAGGVAVAGAGAWFATR